MKTMLVIMLAVALPVLAQTTVKDALVKHWKTSGEFTIGVARSMPAESYNFRPDPEEIQHPVHWLAARAFRWTPGTPLPLILRPA